jgi:hypothetical protein
MRQQQRQKLSAFIERTQHGKARKRSTLELDPSDPQQPFTPARHNLTPEQCHLANQLFRKAEQEHPLYGFRRACRIGGILRAVRRNLVGNSRFGHHLMGYRGGRVMQMHGMHILREIAPIGSLTARVNREKRQAQEVWEQTGNIIAPAERPAHTPEEQRIRDMITQWEEAQWRAQRDRLNW